METLVVGVGTFLSGLLIYKLLTANKPPVYGVYQRCHRWYYLKYIFFYIIVSLRKRQAPKSQENGGSSGYGVKSKAKVEEMDQVQPLPPVEEHPNAVDAVYFNGGSREKDYLVFATARRQMNILQTIGLIRIHKLGLLELPDMPETNYITSFDNAFKIEGLSIEMVEEMKEWTISIDRLMRLTLKDGTVKENVRVKSKITWTALHPIFDFDTDQDIHVLCDAVAREPWSREMFQGLQLAHQTHYEQYGEMAGTVYVEGFGDFKVKVQGIRDHSYGNSRDWGLFHRYGLQYAYVEDGTCVCIGSIAIPNLMTHLTLGFVNFPDGRMSPIRYSDFDLSKTGELDGPVKRWTINCETAAGDKFRVVGDVLEAPFFYMGTSWSSIVHERLCQFEVNGKAAWGVSEWQYRNHSVKRPNCDEKSLKWGK